MTENRALGTSGIATPPLVFGGNVFGWTADKATSFRLLDRFADAGGTLVDSADVYSAWAPGNQGGESETIIGEWLRTSGKRGTVQVATKVGYEAGLAPETIIAGCDASLKRLGVDTIDLFFAHRDDPNVPQEDVLGVFDTLIKAGKVRAIAASNFRAARFKEALEIATRDGLPHYRALQPQYNLVHRHAYEGELQDLCVTHNIGVIPYYALAAGFLTGKYRSEADLGKSTRGGQQRELLQGKGLAVLNAMDAIAAETGATLAQIALAWLAAQPGVTAPIASATSIAQLDELIGAWDVKLAPEQLDRLTAAGA